MITGTLCLFPAVTLLTPALLNLTKAALCDLSLKPWPLRKFYSTGTSFAVSQSLESQRYSWVSELWEPPKERGLATSEVPLFGVFPILGVLIRRSLNHHQGSIRCHYLASTKQRLVSPLSSGLFQTWRRGLSARSWLASCSVGSFPCMLSSSLLHCLSIQDMEQPGLAAASWQFLPNRFNHWNLVSSTAKTKLAY